MLKVLATGQSNLLGRHPGGSPETAIHPRALIWNGGAGPASIVPGDAFIRPNYNAQPIGSPGDATNHFPTWFCHRAALELDDDVRLVAVAAGGRHIEEWLNDNPDPESDDLAFFPTILTRLADSGLGSVDVILWHQGENNAFGEHNKTTEEYKALFRQLEARFRSEGVLKPGRPIVVGEIIRLNSDHIRQALLELADEDPLTFHASAAGMFGAPGDPTHFDGHELEIFGRQRYWDAYTEFLGIPATPGPKVVTGEIGLPAFF